ncbi:hypothetical protein QQ045_031105 [Rhodiola kirilowii]
MNLVAFGNKSSIVIAYLLKRNHISNFPGFENLCSGSPIAAMGVAPSALLPPINRKSFLIPIPPPPAHDRTLFIMFSKGFKVTKAELQEFITLCFGDCIDTLNMQETQGDEKPVLAQIVFYSPETVDAVLNGGTKAKFIVNGNHAFVRKLK